MLDILTEQGLAYFSILFMIPVPFHSLRASSVPLLEMEFRTCPNPQSQSQIPSLVPRFSFTSNCAKIHMDNEGLDLGTGICDL